MPRRRRILYLNKRTSVCHPEHDSQERPEDINFFDYLIHCFYSYRVFSHLMISI